MGPTNSESENIGDDDIDDDECHQMVLAWTLQDWKVNVCCKLRFTTERASLLDEAIWHLSLCL